MVSVERISQFVKESLENKFIRNFGWMGGSEFFSRLSYVFTTVTLARCLTQYDYGLAAIVLTVNELMQVFTRMGIGVKIIQSDQEDFDALCNSAYWLNWCVFIALFITQCLASFGVARFYNDPQLILPICTIALIYLIVPISSIQASLVLKENRLKVTALTNTIQLTVGNLMAIGFALAGLGMWSIILPRVLSAPVWVYMFYTSHSWRPTSGFSTKYWGEILKFTKNVLGVQLLKALRNNIDYLLIGRFIGIEQLGIYFFAFNAGLGISLSIINAINSALFPHLCSLRSNWEKFRQQYFNSLKTIALILVPVVVLQASLASFYVPIIFGQKWIIAIPVLILICLSAIPRPFADAASNVIVAVGRPDIDLRWNLIFTTLFMGALLIGVRWQALGVAIAVLASHWLFLPLYTLWVSRFVFSRMQPHTT
ncbi:lipopolysaccharide biosynthesis protein [Leptolyngbya sp. FACHB-36]|uniref:lipopolysaccharide biosynthesis protein n=1 Tax=Leptolyngbya sp. FACHB-36 TaxID=2692808 RepID=UPI001680220C|nr:lipopolysaccharide biosynthesis protein [Leptolyngbya sp. FACHB-36]MBD2022751.1 lipopolysaccharide biosynthesis protein [Leptolyngbya sp. FACHB-36]